MSGFQVNSDGLVAALAELDDRVAKKVGRHATRVALRPALEHVQELCPVSVDGDHGNPPGFLRDSYVIRSVSPRKKHAIGAQITTRDGAFKGDAFYGPMVEFGTSKAAAEPHLRPGLDETKEQVISLLTDELRAGIEREHASDDD